MSAMHAVAPRLAPPEYNLCVFETFNQRENEQDNPN
jgi:hypothetical protein